MSHNSRQFWLYLWISSAFTLSACSGSDSNTSSSLTSSTSAQLQTEPLASRPADAQPQDLQSLSTKKGVKVRFQLPGGFKVVPAEMLPSDPDAFDLADAFVAGQVGGMSAAEFVVALKNVTLDGQGVAVFNPTAYAILSAMDTPGNNETCSNLGSPPSGMRLVQCTEGTSGGQPVNVLELYNTERNTLEFFVRPQKGFYQIQLSVAQTGDVTYGRQSAQTIARTIQ